MVLQRVQEATLSSSKDKTRLRMVQKRLREATLFSSKDKTRLRMVRQRVREATLSSFEDKTWPREIIKWCGRECTRPHSPPLKTKRC